MKWNEIRWKQEFHNQLKNGIFLEKYFPFCDSLQKKNENGYLPMFTIVQ